MQLFLLRIVASFSQYELNLIFFYTWLRNAFLRMALMWCGSYVVQLLPRLHWPLLCTVLETTFITAVAGDWNDPLQSKGLLWLVENLQLCEFLR